MYIQPRLYDHSQDEVLEHLVESARRAEQLRVRGGRVTFVAGCEHILFTPGIVPGATFVERIATIGDLPAEEWPKIQQRLNDFLRRAAAVSRANFRGPVTYGGAHFEPVDWSPFDVVGLDYYQYFESDAEYTADLARFRRWNKPVVVLEFGSCTYPGAPQAGGSGYDIIDHEKEPPEVKPGFVRDEDIQAAHLARMLRVFAAEGMAGAHVYTFVNPEAPHSPVRRLDLDIASFSLVKTIRRRYNDPFSPYRWQPKKSFETIARHNCV